MSVPATIVVRTHVRTRRCTVRAWHPAACCVCRYLRRRPVGLRFVEKRVLGGRYGCPPTWPGRTAEAYVAEDQLLNRTVAIKVVSSQSSPATMRSSNVSAGRLRRRPASTTPASWRSTTAGRTPVPTSSSWSTSRAAPWARSSGPLGPALTIGQDRHRGSRRPGAGPPKGHRPPGREAGQHRDYRGCPDQSHGLRHRPGGPRRRHDRHPDRDGNRHGQLLLSGAGPGRRSISAPMSTAWGLSSTRR